MHKQGDIVLIPIPFTDLTTTKKRPVLVMSSDYYNDTADDIIVVAITSNVDEKPYNVSLTSDDLVEGELLKNSCIKSDKLYTLAQSIVIKKFGHVKNNIIKEVNEKIAEILGSEK